MDDDTAALVGAFGRSGLLDDVDAVADVSAAGFEAVARATSVVLDAPIVTGDRAVSFVLHAPLELLARIGLAQRVVPDTASTARLVSLAARYASRSPVLVTPGPSTVSLADAVSLGGPDAAEAAVYAETDPGRLDEQLAEAAVLRTAAAGHANIWVHLRDSVPTDGLAPMARGLVRDLALDPSSVIDISPGPGGGDRPVIDAFLDVASAGPPQSGGIAALVAHVTSTNPDGTSAFVASALADPDARRSLLRLAAAQMIAGGDHVVPYGWTHALTLTQAALAVEKHTPSHEALTAAATYTLAFWSAYGSGTAEVIELATTPPTTTCAPEALASDALGAHDAHLVKYTLACLQYAAADPDAAGLFLTAAQRLHTWWAQNPPADDPLTSSEA